MRGVNGIVYAQGYSALEGFYRFKHVSVVTLEKGSLTSSEPRRYRRMNRENEAPLAARSDLHIADETEHLSRFSRGLYRSRCVAAH
jgi:hypothetical protein